MTKDEFHLQCAWRNREVQAFLLSFWQDFPLIVRRENPEAPILSSSDGDFSVESLGNECYTLRPVAFAHLPSVAAMERLLERGPMAGLAVVFKGAAEYWRLLGRDMAEYQARVKVFSERWPLLSVFWPANPFGPQAASPRGSFMEDPALVLKDPTSAGAAGPLVGQVIQGLKGQGLTSLSAIRDRFREAAAKVMFERAAIWVPIYADTTAADLDWNQIAQLQAKHYGKKRRSRGGEDGQRYRQLLDIWDAYEVEHAFSPIAKRLRLPVSTVRSRYLIAEAHIRQAGTSADPHPAPRQMPRLESDMRSCTTCSRAKRLEDLCARHRRSVGPERSQRETPVADLDALQAAQAGRHWKRLPKKDA